MPNYNLWYALKFMHPDTVVILDRPYIEREYPGTSYFTAKINFVSLWLSQIIGVSTHTSYSLDGSWNRYLSSENGDIIDKVGVKGLNNFERRIFIDNSDNSSLEYIKEYHPELEYFEVSEFIKVYNKNPRVYEKKDSKDQKV